MQIRFKQFLCYVACLLLFCENQPVSNMPAEIDIQGNCIGTVRNTSGSVIASASVLLVSEDYDPMSSTDAAAPESTLTNEKGKFSFSVKRSGVYNILTHYKNNYSFLSKIEIKTSGKTEKDAVVTPPGSMQGVIRLEGKTDHHSAVILFPGTNRYTQPKDTSGTYTIDALAPGNYHVRVISLLSGFTISDTVITISSGSITTCPAIILKAKQIPTVNNFNVVYDSLLMTSTLTWSAADTSLIKGYSIYLNRDRNLTPVACLDKTDTSITFDILDNPAKKYIYQIAAVDRNDIVGPATTGKSFVKSIGLTRTRTIPYEKFHEMYIPKVAIDPEGNFIIQYEHITGKLSPAGKVIGSYSGDFLTGGDKFGNLYFDNYDMDTSWLVRTNQALMPLDSFKYHIHTHPDIINFDIVPLWDGGVEVRQQSITDPVNGTIEYYISQYDTGLNKIGESHSNEIKYVDYHLYSYSRQHCIGGASHVFTDSIDRAFSTLTSMSFLDRWIPEGYESSYRYCITAAGPYGICAVGYMREDQPFNEDPWGSKTDLLIVFTLEGKVLARIPFNASPSEFLFDSKGDLYQSIWIYGGTADTLVQYNTSSLLK